MKTLARWEIYPPVTQMPIGSDRPKFSKVLAEVVEQGNLDAAADPSYGIDGLEWVKRFRRVGPYSDGASACWQGRWANSRHSTEQGGIFEYHSQQLAPDDKRAWLIIRFIPDRSPEVGLRVNGKTPANQDQDIYSGSLATAGAAVSGGVEAS